MSQFDVVDMFEDNTTTPIWNTTTPATSPSASADDGMLRALTMTFSIIAFGYFAAKFSLLPPPDLGLAQFVGRVGLPSVVFVAIATLDVSTLNWNLVAALAIGKTIVFFGVVIISLITNRKRSDRMAIAGIRGIFCNMSNDFALGLPLLTAMYPPEMTRYLYVVAPINFLWINVLGFSMMEYSNSKQIKHLENERGVSKPRAKKRSRVLVVFVGVLKNPVIFMTIIGVLCNIVFDHQLSRILKGPFETLANVFGGGALVLLGMSMSNKIFFLRGTKLITALLLIATKTILLPVVTKAMMNIISPEDDYSGDFSFLVSTFPSAPGVLAFSLQYGIQPTQIAAMVVLCTILSAPIMFLSAKLIDIPAEESKVSEMTGRAAQFMASISIVCCAMLIALYMLNKRYRFALDRAVLSIAFFAIFYAVAESTCDMKISDDRAKIRHMFAHFGWISTCMWVSTYGLILHASLYNWRRSHKTVVYVAPIVNVAIASILTGTIYIDMQNNAVELAANYECYYIPPTRLDHGYISAKIIFPVFTLLTIVVIASIRASFPTRPQLKNGDVLDENYEDTFPNLEVAADVAVEEFTPLINARSDDITVVEMSTNRLHADQFKHNIYLVIEVLCMSLAAAHSCLSFGKAGGPKFELNFIDVIMNASRGIFLFLCFGTDELLWVPIGTFFQPLRSWWRRLIFSTETPDLARSRQWYMLALSENDSKLQADCLHVIPYLHRDRVSLEQSKVYGLRKYNKVFTGTQLVDWMLAQSLAGDRATSTRLCRILLLQGCFSHVTNEHHFYDSNYFYRFENLDSIMHKYNCSILQPLKPSQTP
eukprot:m.83098 g.83098  ORF g.83098 m.83098 type:complete len:821 (-) comp25594_c0_seq2:180-2642(-)